MIRLASHRHFSRSVRQAILAFIVGVGLTMASEAALAGGPSLEVVSSWGGPVNAVQVEGDIAYVGSGRRLVVLDISNVAAMTEIGSIDLLSGVVDLVVRDGYAYVSTREVKLNGFCVVDVSDPANMVVLDHDSDDFYLPGEVHLYGDLAYVTGRSGDEMHIFDVSNPADILYVSKSDTLIGDDFFLSGDLLYGIRQAPEGAGTRLRIYNLAVDPFNPPIVGSLVIPPFCSGDPVSIYVDGGYAYICRRAGCGEPTVQAALLIVNISDPADPFLVTTYGSALVPQDVVVTNDTALVVGWTGGNPNGQGLVVLDVSDPANPVQISAFTTHGNVRRVRLAGDRAYVFDDGEGLIALDISNPARLVRLGNYYSPSYIGEVHKEGELIYVSDRWNGLTILHVDDPQSTPTVVGVYQTPTGVTDMRSIDVRNGIAYLSEGYAGWAAIDVSDPADPTFAGAFSPWPANVECCSLALNPVSGILHVGTQPGAFLVNFDVSDLRNVVDVGLGFLGGSNAFVYDIEVTPDGNTCHLGRDLACQAVNVSVPTAPVVQHTQPANNPVDVALSGTSRYLVDSSLPPDVRIQDVTNPGSPADLGSINLLPGVAWSADVSGNRFYVAGSYGSIGRGLRLYDVTNPAQRVLQSFAAAAEANSHVLADEPLVFLSTQGSLSDGLVVFHVDGLPPLCTADINDSGVVNIDDLLSVINAWGPCANPFNCPADVAPAIGNDQVNIDDLLAVINGWGVCE
jgi:hypothetical protein